ncbi:unnamed protein product, partial [Ectocarpus sp. 8 AP-2014]
LLRLKKCRNEVWLRMWRPSPPPACWAAAAGSLRLEDRVHGVTNVVALELVRFLVVE